MSRKDIFGVAFATWFFIGVLAFQLADALRNFKMTVPDAVAVGDTVTLSCQYDLENEALYLVRWMFNGEEIYRFVPKEEPAGMSFTDVSGVSIDMNKSNAQNVTIKSLSIEQSGEYQCEVSADAPLFHTLTSVANLEVAILPESEPVMHVYGIPLEKTRYVTIGDQLKASCVSGPSQPFVNFTWRVDDKLFPTTASGLRETGYNHSWESREAWSELMLTVDRDLLSRVSTPKSRIYNHRQLKIRCETNIYSLYKGATEMDVDVVGDPLESNGISSLGGKVSPTIDQRGSPDNSALTGNAIVWTGGFNSYMFRMFLCFGLFSICSL